jgi:hypothetical protein
MPAMIARRAVLCLPLASLGCAGLGGPPRILLTAADLERLLQREFPREHRLLEVFDVTLQPPKLRLLPQQRRIGAVFDLRARERFMHGTWNGQLTFDSALRWDGSDRSLRLQDVRVGDLALADPAAPSRSVVERLGAALAQRVLENMAVWRLPNERWLELQGRGLAPGTVSIGERGVELAFVAAPR